MAFSYSIPKTEETKIDSCFASLISVCSSKEDFSEVFLMSREIHKSKSIIGLQIDVSIKRKNRSRPQENYYRKWCGRFADFCGLTPDEMHEEMLFKTFGSEQVETKMGIRRRPNKRSSGTNTSTYADLIDALVRVSANMGFEVPLPNSWE